jgi:hypothetical protein
MSGIARKDGRGYPRFLPGSELNLPRMGSREETTPPVARCGYFPAIACIICDSPIDALVALCVPRVEAMMIVSASWPRADATECFVATLHGGRPIAALRTPEGRWAACNAFLEELFATPEAAARRLTQLLKRGRRGYIGYLPCALQSSS